MEIKPYKILNRGERKAQNFDKDNIEVIKCGQKINVYQAIQDAREDTELYPTLEKYGCIDKLPIDHAKVYGDLTQIKDLKDIMQQQIDAENLWLSLPLDVRRQFNHSKAEFIEKGAEWLEKEIEKNKPVVTLPEVNPDVEIKNPVINQGELANG